MSIDECRMNVFSLFKKDFAKRCHPSKFDIRYSMFCGSLFNPASKAARLIVKKPCHFGVVSHERRLWPEKTASLIGKKTLLFHKRQVTLAAQPDLRGF